ncbi:rhomboid family intramembrane serine protease [Mariniblastus sp.]|nr:rhomboid family intramembrane serine protease [Mariniblastus sp.]
MQKFTLTDAGSNHTNSVGDEISGVLTFVAVIWFAFFADWALPLSEWFALIPRDLARLPGIVAMTFLHADFRHLLANTVPLIILLTLLSGSRVNSWQTVTMIVVTGGTLLWLFGRNGTQLHVVSHIGASLLVFGLITFFLAAAWFEMRVVSIVIAVLVGVLYGWSLLFGVVPMQRGVSWDGHLCGAIAGVIVAFVQSRMTGRLPAAVAST